MCEIQNKTLNICSDSIKKYSRRKKFFINEKIVLFVKFLGVKLPSVVVYFIFLFFPPFLVKVRVIKSTVAAQSLISLFTYRVTFPSEWRRYRPQGQGLQDFFSR